MWTLLFNTWNICDCLNACAHVFVCIKFCSLLVNNIYQEPSTRFSKSWRFCLFPATWRNSYVTASTVCFISPEWFEHLVLSQYKILLVSYALWPNHVVFQFVQNGINYKLLLKYFEFLPKHGLGLMVVVDSSTAPEFLIGGEKLYARACNCFNLCKPV